MRLVEVESSLCNSQIQNAGEVTLGVLYFVPGGRIELPTLGL